MTKEITKAFILQQMQDKMKLRELEPEIFSFSEMVIPVYNIEQHLQLWRMTFTEKSVTTTGGLIFFTVPHNERWYLRAYDVVFMGAGAYTVAGVYATRVNSSPYSSVYLDMTAGQTVSYHHDLPNLLPLEPGDCLYINVDGYTSTQDLRLYIDFMREEIR